MDVEKNFSELGIKANQLEHLIGNTDNSKQIYEILSLHGTSQKSNGFIFRLENNSGNTYHGFAHSYISLSNHINDILLQGTKTPLNLTVLCEYDMKWVSLTLMQDEPVKITSTAQAKDVWFLAKETYTFAWESYNVVRRMIQDWKHTKDNETSLNIKTTLTLV